MGDKTESRIQQEMVRWFRNNHGLNHHDPQCVIFSVPNEMTMQIAGTLKSLGVSQAVVRRASSMITNLFKSTGMMSGVSDLIVLLPGRVLFVEVKTSAGRQSEKQKKFESLVSRLGFDYHIVRSLEEFKEVLK